MKQGLLVFVPSIENPDNISDGATIVRLVFIY